MDEINNCDGCIFLYIMKWELGEGDYNGEDCFNFIKDFLFNPEKRDLNYIPVVLLEQESAPEYYTKEWFKN